MDQNVAVKDMPRYYSVAKFFIMSAIGIFSFFITFKIGEKDTFLANHLNDFIKDISKPILPYYVVILAVLCVLDVFKRKERFFKGIVNSLLSIAKIIGAVLIVCVVFGFGPPQLLQANVGPFVLNKLLIPLSITVIVAAIFLPFLLDYGFIDFVGVLARPIMRPAFKTPGRSAVIAVSAFLGNFSIGHIAVDTMYKEGKLTEKEAAIIGTGFCTVSVAFLMVLANVLKLMEHWNFYFWSAFLVTAATTFFTVRIWPLATKPDTTFPGVTPQPEKIYHTALFKNAFIEGIEVAEKAESIFVRLGFIFKESMLIIMALVCGGMFFTSFGIIINQNTPFFQYLGYVFYPFFKLVNIPDIAVAMNAAGISFLDIMIPAVLGGAEGVAIQTKFVIGNICVSGIIFIAGFVPCILSTDIPVKVFELIVIWLQRIIFTILLSGGLALIYF
ncbi:YjiH family protein [Desulfocicer niacini]